jgi:hypothetical protein
MKNLDVSRVWKQNEQESKQTKQSKIKSCKKTYIILVIRLFMPQPFPTLLST